MVAEVIEALAVRPGGRYIDATVGLGGHAEAILEAAQPNGTLMGVDLDPQALKFTQKRLVRFEAALLLSHGHDREIAKFASKHNFEQVDGVIFDLGVSSLQLEAPGRGFSFQRNDPLDMRMNPDTDLSAAKIVNEYEEGDLAQLLYQFGEEPRSRAIARAIVAARPLHTTGELASVIAQVAGRGRERRINPATLTFQALRIAVNQELDFLEDTLSAACDLLDGAGGRIVVISFHSLEDRIVKHFFRQASRDCICPARSPGCVCGHRASLRVVSKRVRKPSAAEVARNPRARSARMRVAETLGERAA